MNLISLKHELISERKILLKSNKRGSITQRKEEICIFNDLIESQQIDN